MSSDMSSDDAMPHTVQRRPKYCQCLSPIGLLFFGRLFVWSGPWTLQF